MPTKFNPRRRTKKGAMGVPVKRVQDPMNPMASYWVDAYGKRTKAPSGSSGSVSSGTLGVGKNTPLTQTSIAQRPGDIKSRKMWSSSYKRAMESLTGISENNSLGANAALGAMAVVPVPAPLKRGVAAGAQIVGKAVGKAAGKTNRAVAKDTARAAGRRTKSESATIRKGDQTAKTPEMAKKLEQQSAAASSSKSVNTAPKSSVVPRTGTATGSLPKGITSKRAAEFSADKGGRIANARKIKRTPAQARRAQADLEESLKRGSQARAEGRKPGEDIPAATGRGIYDPVPAPRSTPRQIDRELVTKALTKPRNPGKNASPAKKAKYEKDLAAYNKRQADMKSKTKDIDEGRRKPTGELKGASAKSARRNEEKRAKNAAAAARTKKPSAKTSPAAADAKITGKQGKFPKKPTKAQREQSARDIDSARARNAAEARQASAASARSDRMTKAADARSARNATAASARAERTKKANAAFAERQSRATSARTQGQAKNKKKTKAAAVLGAAGVLGAGAMMLGDSGAGKNDTAKPATSSSSPKAKDYVRDNKGRKVSREEFEERKAFREKYGLTKKSGESLADYRKRVEAWKAKNKKKTKAEMARRKDYRQGEGVRRFGKSATTKTRKSGTRRVGFDSDARKALR